MAFNKLFFALAIVSCAIAMPVHDSEQSADVETTTNAALRVEDSTVLTEEPTSVTSVTSASEETTVKEVTDSIEEKSLDLEAENDRDTLIKRSIEGESSDEDMETAAGTNVLRPLFVYRQQVAYRQRFRNTNRRGNRRF